MQQNKDKGYSTTKMRCLLRRTIDYMNHLNFTKPYSTFQHNRTIFISLIDYQKPSYECYVPGRIVTKLSYSTRAKSSFVYTNKGQPYNGLSIREILTPDLNNLSKNLKENGLSRLRHLFNPSNSSVPYGRETNITKPLTYRNREIRKLGRIDPAVLKNTNAKDWRISPVNVASKSNRFTPALGRGEVLQNLVDQNKLYRSNKIYKNSITPSKNLLNGSYSKLTEIKLITVSLASATRIRQWAEKTLPNGKVIGEVINAETLHYKTFKPIKGGLFCERIFGPLKDHICACGKKFNLKTYLRQQGDSILSVPKSINEIGEGGTSNKTISLEQELTEANGTKLKKRYFCRLCDVEYTFSTMRRTQLGYIKLATPVTHVWFVKGASNYMSILLDMKKKDLHQIIYNYGTLTFENALKGKQLVFIKPADLYATWAQVTKPKIGDKSNKLHELKNVVDDLYQNKSGVLAVFGAKAPRELRSVKLTQAQAYQQNKQSYFSSFHTQELTCLKNTSTNHANVRDPFSKVEKTLFKKSYEHFVSLLWPEGEKMLDRKSDDLKLMKNLSHIFPNKTGKRQKKTQKKWYNVLKQYFLKCELPRKHKKQDYYSISRHNVNYPTQAKPTLLYTNKKDKYIKVFSNVLNVADVNHLKTIKYGLLFNRVETLNNFQENTVLFAFLPFFKHDPFMQKDSLRHTLSEAYQNLLGHYTKKASKPLNSNNVTNNRLNVLSEMNNGSAFVLSNGTVVLKGSLSHNIDRKLGNKYSNLDSNRTKLMQRSSSQTEQSSALALFGYKGYSFVTRSGNSNIVYYKKLLNKSISLFVSLISKEGYTLCNIGNNKGSSAGLSSVLFNKTEPLQRSCITGGRQLQSSAIAKAPILSGLYVPSKNDRNISDIIKYDLNAIVNSKIQSSHPTCWGFKYKTLIKNENIENLVNNVTILLFINLNKKYKSHYVNSSQNTFNCKLNLQSKTIFNNHFKVNYSLINNSDVLIKNPGKTKMVTVKCLRSFPLFYEQKIKDKWNLSTLFYCVNNVTNRSVNNTHIIAANSIINVIKKPKYGSDDNIQDNIFKTSKIFQNNLFSKLINNIYCMSHRFVWEEEKNWRRFSLYYYAPKCGELASIPIYKNRNYEEIFNFDSMGFLYTNEAGKTKQQIQIAQARQQLKSMTNTMNIYTTFSGPGIIEKLLNEYNFIELKKMDKQNRILLVEYNKHVAQLKKAIPVPIKSTTRFYQDTVANRSSHKNLIIPAVALPQSGKKLQHAVKSRLEYYKACHIRDIAIRRTKLIRKLAIKGGSNYNGFTQNSGSVFRQSSYGQSTDINVTSNLNMVLTVLPVLPPDLRPIVKMDGKQATADLNMFYKNIIYRNERLKKFLKDPALNNSFEMKYAQRLVQEAVDNLIQNGKSGDAIKDARGRLLKSLSDALKGKQGRFRQYLLGKRVDYSARSVIVVGPRLKIHECGIPKEIALTLYLPFLIKRILNEKLALTVPGAKGLIQKQSPLIWQLLREIMKTCPVLLNRAPTLHRLGFQAFQPKLIEGKAILLHPLVCPSFNADFDGDQMAVHIPITNEAKAEAWKLMLARNNLLSPAIGEPIILPSQDMVLGCYYLTTFCTEKFTKYKKGTGFYFQNLDDVLKAYHQQLIDIHAHIWVNLTDFLKKRASDVPKMFDKSTLSNSSLAGRSNDQPLEIRLSMFQYKLAEGNLSQPRLINNSTKAEANGPMLITDSNEVARSYSQTEPIATKQSLALAPLQGVNATKLQRLQQSSALETTNLLYRTLIIYSKTHEFRDISSQGENPDLNTVSALHIVRTTPGRVLFNALIQKALTKSPTFLT